MGRFRLDRLTVAMLAAASLDALTTYCFLSRRLGVELNPVLAQLINSSLLWIPVYIVLPKLLVGTMTTPTRQAFASFYLTLCSIFAINNLIGICGGLYFLDAIGVRTAEVAALIVAVACFARLLSSRSADRVHATQAIRGVVCWVGVYVLIEGAFLVVSRTVSS